MRTISLARRFSHPSNATEKVMNNISKALVLAVTALTLTAASASAAVVCNAEGDCWRVRGAPRYEPSLRLRIFPDSWRRREGEHYRWRDPGRGHGYWRGGSWIEIR
jgi:hypothetical protein